MNTIILLKLLFAHIVCDFVLQTKKMVDIKQGNHKKEKTVILILHSFIQAFAAYIIVAQWGCWYLPVIIFITHWGLDWWKSLKQNDIRSFITDQSLHLLVIIVLWLLITAQFSVFSKWLLDMCSQPRFWLITTAYLLVLKPSSILISLFIKRWTPDVRPRKEERVLNTDENESLQKAGLWIGYLERILILTFILMGYISAVGFLFAAKSIFRIGDLRPGRNLKLTEYVLIGTFSSFFIAILAGIIAKSVA